MGKTKRSDIKKIGITNLDTIIPVGNHLILEISEANSKLLKDLNYVKKIIIAAAKRGGATVIDSIFHSSDSQGIIGIVVVAESHIAIHTFPEKNQAAVDIFFCGNNMNTDLASKIIKTGLKAKKSQKTLIVRGPKKDISSI